MTSTTAARRNGAVNSSGTAVSAMVAVGTLLGAIGFQGLSPAACLGEVSSCERDVQLGESFA
jgi:hypothetical protein